VKILEASIVENAMELSKQTPEEIMGKMPESKKQDREDTRVHSQVARGTPKRLMKNLLKESLNAVTTPKRLKKISVAKKSPSLSPEVPEWMKDKNVC
jgi:hypothetical protein